MDMLAGMRVFVRAVEAGSFSAAGRRLGMAPSSVSRQIADLEDELGARLFQRTTRKLSLTEAGRTYHAHALRILADVDEARAAVADPEDAPAGVLRVTLPTTIARLQIAPVLSEFQARYPGIRLVLAVTDRVSDVVEEGLDVALRFGRLPESRLVARRIGTRRRVVCASPGYLKRAGTPETPADLAGHNCLTFNTNPGRNVWRFRGPEGETEVRVAGSLFSDSGETLCAAAAADLGVILVPEWLVEVELRNGALRELLPGYPAVPPDTPLYAIYPHRRHLPPKVRAFIDFLVESSVAA